MTLKVLCMTSLMLALCACGGGGAGDDAASTTPQDDTQEGSTVTRPSVPDLVQGIDPALIGTWDWSEEFDNGTVDEVYLSIDEQGRLSEYDYAGDTFEGGENCYRISRHWGKFSRSGNEYLYSEVGTEASLLVSLDIDNGDLYLTALEFDEVFGFPVGERILFATGMRNPLRVEDMDAMACL